MTITNLAFPEYIRYPNWGNAESSFWDRTGLYVDAAGEYFCGILPAPKSGDISKVHFFTGFNGADGDIDVRIETVDAATGFPTGTLWDTNTEVTVSWADDYELIIATLTAAATVTQGDPIAVKLRANSSSVPTGDIATADNEIWPGFPYCIFNTGSPTRNYRSPSIWLEYSDGSVPNLGWQRRLNLAESVADVNNTIDYRYGIRFQMPFDAVISGAWMVADFGSGANTLELYNPNGVDVVKTLSIDPDDVQSINNSQPTYHLFPTDFNAKARTWYRLVYRTTAGAGAKHQAFGQPSLSQQALPGGWDFISEDLGGLISPVHYTKTSSASNPTSESDWTNSFDQVTPMAVLISEISEWVNPTYFLVPEQVFV